MDNTTYSSNTNQGNNDLEIKSQKFLNELVLNVVLRELPTKELRMEFYNLINSQAYDDAESFINEHILNFKEKLLEGTKDLLNK